MKNLIKSGKNIVKTSLLAAALAFPSTKNIEAQTNHNFFDAKLGINHEHTLVNKLNDIPLKIRDVPEDSDSYYLSDSERIINKKDNIKSSDYPSFVNIRAGNKTSFSDNLKLNLGVSLDIGLDWGTMNKKEDNNFKLYKPACSGPIYDEVYYKIYSAFVHKSNKWLKPSAFSEIELKLMKNDLITAKDFSFRGINLFLGYRLYLQKIVAENGWTTSEGSTNTKAKKKYELTNSIIGGPYATLTSNIIDNPNDPDNAGLFLNFGLNRLVKNKPTDLGKQTDINFDKFGWYAGLGMYCQF